MSKQHRDFVQYVRNGVAINALVAFSHDVYTPATQTTPATTAEYLNLVYLDPAAAGPSQTGDQLRNSIKIEFSVPPLGNGMVNGWQDVPTPSAANGAPSAADLDAVAAEQAAKAATAQPANAPEVTE